MGKKTVLYIVHNHPSVRPGGAETYALELYQAMHGSDEFTPLLLAKGGPPVSPVGQTHGGTPFAHVNGDPNQYFLHTDGRFDWFLGVLEAKEVLTRFFREFLEATRPDLVHFQHTQHFGYDMLRVVRSTLPGCAIVYTLHEFLPICHRQGQMLRVGENAPCWDAAPWRCHTCFPQHTPQDFFMRKKFIQSHLALVDLFIAPSRFLLERYVHWGLPREKIIDEDYGRQPMDPAPQAAAERPHPRLAFFGQINPYKGVDVLLEAMRLLAERRNEGWEAGLSPAKQPPRPQLKIFGANLDLQEGSFQTRIRALLEATRRDVTLAGRYEPAQLAGLMAETDWVVVPSIWWENSPLVIQEAFGHGRPVICSNIGGMAEKVRDGVDGLHFRAGDPASLADAIERAVATPRLWDSLVRNLSQVYPMNEHTRVLSRYYLKLLAEKAERRAA
jgi:glycosyltransferase involved in cell wall biosynthesis